MKLLKSICSVLFSALILSTGALAAEGDLYIQVELNTNPQGCSILEVSPSGQLSEFISNEQILNLTDETTVDCDDTGLAVGLDGRVYFNEDTSDNIFVATPNGELGIFITDDVVESIAPGTVDWDNGLAISPVTGNLVAADEDNEILFEFPTDVPTPITNPDLIRILADEDDFEALVPTADLEGGIAIDFEDNIYITNNGGGVSRVIFKRTQQGQLSILCTNAELEAVAGGDISLDLGAVFGGKLYVADDNTCDCVFEIDTNFCNPQIGISTEAITAATGNVPDMEGGLCINADSNIFIGDDGGNEPNILLSPFIDRNDVSVFVSDNAIDNFYFSLDPDANPRFRGGCGIEAGFDRGSRPIPTLSEWGLIATVLVLGLVGFIVLRKRAVRA